MLYVLINKNKFVYVGKSNHIKQRIAAHKKDKVFDRHIRLYSNREDIKEVQLINKLKPTHNKRLGGYRLRILAGC